MIILIPMGGEGSRFRKEGYKINKAEIPVLDRHSGKELPMIICALKDIPWLKNKRNKLKQIKSRINLDSAMNRTENMIHSKSNNKPLHHQIWML